MPDLPKARYGISRVLGGSTRWETRPETNSCETTTRTPREWVAWLSPGLLVIIGIVLFFIPAPPTTLLGIALVIVGGALWLVDYFGGETRRRRPEAETGSESR